MGSDNLYFRKNAERKKRKENIINQNIKGLKYKIRGKDDKIYKYLAKVNIS